MLQLFRSSAPSLCYRSTAASQSYSGTPYDFHQAGLWKQVLACRIPEHLMDVEIVLAGTRKLDSPPCDLTKRTQWPPGRPRISRGVLAAGRGKSYQVGFPGRELPRHGGTYGIG